jgi:ribosomal protein RSM22 (predicted rRNA methylase)
VNFVYAMNALRSAKRSPIGTAGSIRRGVHRIGRYNSLDHGNPYVSPIYRNLIVSNLEDSSTKNFVVIRSMSTNSTEVKAGVPVNGDDSEDESDEDGEEAVSMQPWKNLLEAPARAVWRVTDPQTPEALLQAQNAILQDGDRTTRQLKRTYERILAKHSDLAMLRERERRRMVNGKKSTTDDSADPVFYAHDQTLANLKLRLLPNYAIAKRVLKECQSLLGHDNFQPKRILDFGIGSGSASAAALEIFDTVEWIHGIDPSQSMRDCSQRLIEGVSQDRTIIPRVTYSGSLSADAASTGSGFDLVLCSYTAMELPHIASNLAAAAILFEKLQPNGVLVFIEPGTPDGFNSLRAVRNMLLDCCPPEDPEYEFGDRCHVIAPCTHNGACPMERHKSNFVKSNKFAYDKPQVLDDSDEDSDSDKEPEEADADWEEHDDDFIDLSSHHGLAEETDVFNSSFCSFVHTMPGAGPRSKGEKFSYLVVQKRNSEVTAPDMDRSNPFKDVHLAHMLARVYEADYQQDHRALDGLFQEAQEVESRYLDSDADDLGLELLRGDKSRTSLGRIIRAPIKKRGHVYIDYCASPGRIIRNRVTKRMSNMAPGVFAAARKSRWGGFWPDIMDRLFSKNEPKT